MRTLAMVVLALLCIMLLSSCNPNIPDSVRSRVISEMDEENPEFSFGNGEDVYKMGYNPYDMPIFIDMDKAFDQMCIDYADAIEVLKNEFDLNPISKDYWYAYGSYGDQLMIDDKEMQWKAYDVSLFFDIYDNGFTGDQIKQIIAS